MRVMDKPPEEARGSFIWTLLQGKALEVVEHLDEDSYQKKGGEKVLFDLLDKRWPEKDRADQMGENIAEGFNLKAKDGETIRAWCARSRETFDRCQRKSGVKFPDEARGWILLHCGGLSESEHAVVLARAAGSLKLDDVSQSMRSCFPDYVVSRKKTVGAHLVEDQLSPESPDLDEAGNALGSEFADVEQFLAEHGVADLPEPNAESIPGEWTEREAAEVLAATWKNRRQELHRLQKSRKFDQMKDVKRAFRVEVAEVRRRSKWCWKCKKLGHYARECRSKGPAVAASSSASTRDQAANSVEHVSSEWQEHFVCVCVCVGTPPIDKGGEHCNLPGGVVGEQPWLRSNRQWVRKNDCGWGNLGRVSSAVEGERNPSEARAEGN